MMLSNKNIDRSLCWRTVGRVMTRPVVLLVLFFAVAGASATAATQDQRLLEAVIAGDREAAEVALRRGADPNTSDATGVTALMYAVAREHLFFIPFLVERGADVDAQSRDGQTALIVAIMREFLEAVDALLEQGADIDKVGSNGATALHVAVIRFPDALPKLIDAGGDVDALDVSGWSPLMHAAALGDEGAVSVLLKADADTEVADQQGRTARDLAQQAGHEAVVLLLNAASDGARPPLLGSPPTPAPIAVPAFSLWAGLVLLVALFGLATRALRTHD